MVPYHTGCRKQTSHVFVRHFAELQTCPNAKISGFLMSAKTDDTTPVHSWNHEWHWPCTKQICMSNNLHCPGFAGHMYTYIEALQHSDWKVTQPRCLVSEGDVLPMELVIRQTYINWQSRSFLKNAILWTVAKSVHQLPVKLLKLIDLKGVRNHSDAISNQGCAITVTSATEGCATTITSSATKPTSIDSQEAFQNMQSSEQ